MMMILLNPQKLMNFSRHITEISTSPHTHITSHVLNRTFTSDKSIDIIYSNGGYFYASARGGHLCCQACSKAHRLLDATPAFAGVYFLLNKLSVYPYPPMEIDVKAQVGQKVRGSKSDITFCVWKRLGSIKKHKWVAPLCAKYTQRQLFLCDVYLFHLVAL